MWLVMFPKWFDKHPNNNSVESGQFRHEEKKLKAFSPQTMYSLKSSIGSSNRGGMVILPRKHPKLFNSLSCSTGVGLMASCCALTRTRYLSQSEGNGRCKVLSACGSSIAVNELIEETYVDMLKKKEKIEGCAALHHSPKTRQKSQGSRAGGGNTSKKF